MLAATTTVRVSTETREAISKLSSARGMSNADLVAQLVALEQERVLLSEMESHFTELASDPEAFEAYQAEQRIWDVTAGDGLE